MTATPHVIVSNDEAPLGIADWELGTGYVVEPVRRCPVPRGLLIWLESVAAEEAARFKRMSQPDERKHVSVDDALKIAKENRYDGLSCCFGDGRKQILACKPGTRWGSQG